MLTLNGIPFTTGRATYRDLHPESVSGKSAIYVQVVLPIHIGMSFYAIVDTGSPYCIFDTEIAEALGFSFDDGEGIKEARQNSLAISRLNVLRLTLCSTL